MRESFLAPIPAGIHSCDPAQMRIDCPLNHPPRAHAAPPSYSGTILRVRPRRLWLLGFLNWGCTGTCSLTVIAWAVSTLCTPVYQHRMGATACSWTLARGTLFLDCLYWPPGTRSTDFEHQFAGRHFLPGYQRVEPTSCFPNVSNPIIFTNAWLPLWIPFVLTAIPAALLWWRDRLPPHGNCQNCGYNLTGNISGICSECGTPIGDADRRNSPVP